jgi:hypothetical protein
LQVLGRVQFDGTVPVVGGVGHPGFFAETGNAQFQWVAEAGDTQLAGLAEGLARLILQDRRFPTAGFGGHGEQRTAQ